MNLSMKWLSDFVDVSDISIKDYCDKLTLTGSKVEGYEEMGAEIENVVVARIEKIEPHPDSDHLQICQMNVGTGELVQIVTGAQNVFEGAIVPAALPVARLPHGVVIKDGKLRGVPSHGMLCSMGELNLTTHECPGKEENGILILDDCFADKIGTDIREALMLDDTTVEFEITSNRPDCLSVIGLARESAVSFGRPLSVPTPAVKPLGDGDDVTKYLSVGIEAPDLCYRYAAKVVKNVRIKPSPMWLRMRLAAAGVRPINNIVDITNYVMLEYGQPMHAFDYTQIEGNAIRVRRAADGEQFRSLDDIDHTLDSSMLVIADGKKACALAGVMGGANSEIKDDTKTVVFESACFNGGSVRVTAKKNGMRTESSARFEKGLDAENCMPGLLRACELVQLLDAGDVVDGTIDVYPTKAEPTALPFEPARYNAFLGTDITEARMTEILNDLGCKVENGTIAVPSFRADLACMNDIAEEIMRIHGYDKIVSTKIVAETTEGGRTPKQAFGIDVENALYGMGIDEIQTFSFISPKYYDKIRLPENAALRRSVVISNPLGEDTSVMRTTALPSMLEVLARNANFNNENVRLFEMGSVYLPDADAAKLPYEGKMLTLGMYGDADFYTVKGAIENLLALAAIKNATFVAVADNPSYHPGRCAVVKAGDVTLATFGQVHPLVVENYGLSMPLYAAEIDFDALFEARCADKHYTPLPKFPAITRDFSFICDEALEVGRIISVMQMAGGKQCEGVKLFDIYRGAQVGENKKSVSLRMTLRADDHTMTVEDAEKITKKVLFLLEKELGLTLRA
ncbi:MAG: phenylalanine--tRNA ligase subunit beta [Ruminococcaceae bacterium]|nr:phenylalanine--tRNA ligase subunit beta [Oscillospiraceae bacterium]